MSHFNRSRRNITGPPRRTIARITSDSAPIGTPVQLSSRTRVVILTNDAHNPQIIELPPISSVPVGTVIEFIKEQYLKSPGVSHVFTVRPNGGDAVHDRGLTEGGLVLGGFSNLHFMAGEDEWVGVEPWTDKGAGQNIMHLRPQALYAHLSFTDVLTNFSLSGVGAIDPFGDPAEWEIRNTVRDDTLSKIDDEHVEASTFGVGVYECTASFTIAKSAAAAGENFELLIQHNDDNPNAEDGVDGVNRFDWASQDPRTVVARRRVELEVNDTLNVGFRTTELASYDIDVDRAHFHIQRIDLGSD